MEIFQEDFVDSPGVNAADSSGIHISREVVPKVPSDETSTILLGYSPWPTHENSLAIPPRGSPGLFLSIFQGLVLESLQTFVLDIL